MKKNNKTCIVCGKLYTFCPNCATGREPMWKGIFHDENCKNIYNVCEKYLSKEIDEAGAKELFDECDLSIKDSLHHVLRDIVDKAYAAEPVKEAVAEEIKEEPVVAEEPAAKDVAPAKPRMEKKYKK